MVRRNAKKAVLAITIGALIGLVVTLCLPSGAQTDGAGWQDKTFALAQHPAAGVGGPGGGAWLPFDVTHKDHRRLVIWDGGSSGRRALVSVWCNAGEVDVEWDGGEICLYGEQTGNTTTVYSARVELDNGYRYAGSSIVTGEYIVTVDIAE